MPDLREFLLTWTLPNGSTTNTVMYMRTNTALGTQRASIRDWLQSVCTVVVDTCSVVVPNTGKVVDELTGQMTATWTNATPINVPGTVADEPVADATQGLIRWGTDAIWNGRFVRGRSFIPGIASGELEAGNLSAAAQSALLGDTLGLRSDGQVVWHRPVNGAGGVGFAVTQATVWSELAVLRRRRR